MKFPHAVFGEFLGTAFLLAVIVGSGIMGESLANGNQAITLLANSIATGAGLVALIATFGPVSGAHFNPVVSIMMSVRGDLPWKELPRYIAAQFAGAIVGVVATHGMFGLPLFETASKIRPGSNLMWSEFVATVGLLIVVHKTSRHRVEVVPTAVGCYIAAGYWFTSSTSFANPAVTFARGFTDTFTGINLGDVSGFWIAQMLATLVVVVSISALSVSNPSKKIG